MIWEPETSAQGRHVQGLGSDVDAALARAIKLAREGGHGRYAVNLEAARMRCELACKVELQRLEHGEGTCG